jgi:hypothetical protein
MQLSADRVKLLGGIAAKGIDVMRESWQTYPR